jgi:LytS/YehU family sensor histidine kinase
MLVLSASITLTVSLSLLYDFFVSHTLQTGFNWQDAWIITVHNLSMTLIVVISSYFIYLSKHKRQMEMKYERLKAESIQTKYEVLKNQVDPHFLFNSLNTLNSLIDVSSEKSKDYIRKLSQVFRHALQNKEIITLKEELDFTQSYCSLMQIRFEEALIFIFEIKSEALNRSIVPLSLQVLIENAVKHNIINRKQPLTVTISISEDGNNIIISNPIQRTKIAEEGEGIGLANLSERYRLKWHKNIIIRELNNEFSVTIPLINNESDNHRR